MKKIRVRFAPSPTGFLHIGGLRTALFNFLFARKNNGDFLIRIEDTDQKRSEQKFTDDIMKSLEWLNLHPDEPPIFQSQCINRHKEIIEKLLNEQKAYKFFYPETKTEVIKLKLTEHLSEKTVVINDLVQGEVNVDVSDFEDMIIARSDGSPIYMFAVVVDDNDMHISHIIRGVDHLTNTVRQILIFQILNWEIPKFAHLGLINGDDGKKLSKRHGAVSANEFKENGILPEALQNCLLRLGWSHNNDEIIDFKNAQKLFNLENISPSAAQFDYDKLLFLNNYYLKQYNFEKILPLIKDFLYKKYNNHYKLDWFESLFSDIAERSNTLHDLIEKGDFLLNNNFYCNSAEHPNIHAKKDLLYNIIQDMEKIQDWNLYTLKELLNNFAKTRNVKKSEFMPLIRIAITGTMQSPNLLKIMNILHKEECKQRMKNCIK